MPFVGAAEEVARSASAARVAVDARRPTPPAWAAECGSLPVTPSPTGRRPLAHVWGL